MKWKTESYPNKDDVRIVKVFALIPRCCNDGYTRWLEFVYEVQWFNVGYDDCQWDTNFITTSKEEAEKRLAALVKAGARYVQ